MPWISRARLEGLAIDANQVLRLKDQVAELRLKLECLQDIHNTQKRNLVERVSDLERERDHLRFEVNSLWATVKELGENLEGRAENIPALLREVNSLRRRMQERLNDAKE